MKKIILSLLAIGALHSADALTVDPSGTVQVAGSLVTAGGTLGGVNTSTESRISGGGAAFAQRLLVGIAGDSTPSIFYGPMPTTTLPTGTTGTAIGGGGVMTSGLLSIGDLNSGGLRGGRYSEADPNLYIISGWLPGGAGQRAGLKFSTTPTTSPAPTANAITRMEITPDGYTTFYGPQPQAAQVKVDETAIGGGVIRTGGDLFAGTVSSNNAVISRATPAAATEVVRGDDPRINAGSIKAWVNFDGKAAALTVRGAYNVSSVDRLATGQYRVNFTTPFASVSYVPIITCGPEAMTAYFNQVGALTTTSVSFVCINGPLAATNASIVTVAVMGF